MTERKPTRNPWQDLPPEAKDFVDRHFEGVQVASSLPKDEDLLLEEIIEYVNTRFGRMKYILGLALDFTLLSQQISGHDSSARQARPTLSEHDLFDQYELVTERAGRSSNTLTLICSGNSFGIRKLEEEVVDLFHRMDRSGYPSAYVYNTGQWHKYKDLLVNCFRLSEQGRANAVVKLISLGVSLLPANSFIGRAVPRPLLMQEILNDFPRQGPEENGGLSFQAMAYGFVAADRAHLDIIADKVRTGSSRQKRIGDIDTYLGLDLEASFEVKDMEVSVTNIERQLGGFLRDIQKHGVLGIVIADSITDEARTSLQGEGAHVLTSMELQNCVSVWDWPKQDRAVQGMLHYLAHIEQNPVATNRLLDFIKSRDPDHTSSAFFVD